jgi:hypothetical protein
MRAAPRGAVPRSLATDPRLRAPIRREAAVTVRHYALIQSERKSNCDDCHGSVSSRVPPGTAPRSCVPSRFVHSAFHLRAGTPEGRGRWPARTQARPPYEAPGRDLAPGAQRVLSWCEGRSPRARRATPASSPIGRVTGTSGARGATQGGGMADGDAREESEVSGTARMLAERTRSGEPHDTRTPEAGGCAADHRAVHHCVALLRRRSRCRPTTLPASTSLPGRRTVEVTEPRLAWPPRADDRPGPGSNTRDARAARRAQTRHRLATAGGQDG